MARWKIDLITEIEDRQKYSQEENVGFMLPDILCYILNMKTIISHSIEQTQDIAKEWLASLSIKNDEATIVGLYGNLGAGKTAFTKAVAKELGIDQAITSPTFVIEKIYETKNNHFKRLIHIDAYRLEKGRELQDLDFEQIVENPNNLIIVEWPENVKEILPENHNKIYCEFVDETTRKYKIPLA
jgi:tRNA threonylcarbamoyladenosine biosynthesis protein TsaE